MKLFLETQLGNGQSNLVGKTDAIVNLSNGILREPRVFHIDSQDWFVRHNYHQLRLRHDFIKLGSTMDPKQFRKKLLKDWSLKGGHLFAKHWPALYELGLCKHL